MPGRKTAEGRWMDSAIILRKITSADSNTAAAIEAIDAKIIALDRFYAANNLLHVQVKMPATVTNYDIEIYGDMSPEMAAADPDMAGGERWSQVSGLLNRTRSTFITIFDPPHGHLKVLVTNVTGNFTGGVGVILYSLSQ